MSANSGHVDGGGLTGRFPRREADDSVTEGKTLIGRGLAHDDVLTSIRLIGDLIAGFDHD